MSGTSRTPPARSARPVPSPTPAVERVVKPPQALDRVAPLARSVATVATRDLQLPLLMLGLMLVFLAVQGRIDRRDPKILQLAARQTLELDFELPKTPASARPRRAVPLRVRHVAGSPEATSLVLPDDD